MENILLQTVRDDSDGSIKNRINYPEFIKEMQRTNNETLPDLYLCFIIKTLIDDFGNTLAKIPGCKINKEQFEAMFMENLNEYLGVKTKIE